LGNILVRPVGVGEPNSSATVNVNSRNSVVVEVGAAQDNAGEAIQIVRLDDDLGPGTKVDFIKIDVEGHGLHALRGMSRALPQRPIIDLEQHNFIFTDRAGTRSEIFALLNQLEYSWELPGEICDKPVKLGHPLEIDQIIAFDNPHLFRVHAATNPT
jgi:hypothetical protein